LNKQEVLDLLGSVDAVLTNSHFVYTSGKHGSAYVNKDRVYPHTAVVSRLCREIASQFMGKGVQVVIAPAIGGVILSTWAARHLSDLTEREVLGVYAEKETMAINDPDPILGRKLFTETGNFVIKREYDKIVAGRNVLVVEDLLTTGGSVKKVIEAVRAIGGNMVGLAVLCNRGGITSQDVGGVPELFALTDVKLDAWDEANCPLCAQDLPINTSVGKGKEFLARKQA
jgi:orotate phosphoribosyltransferase